MNFWCFSRKLHFFPKVLFLKSSTVFWCFLHVNDVHSWRYSWNCGNQINVPHCQLATHCCRCHFCFGCLKVQEQRLPKYWFSFTCLVPWFRSSLLWFLDALRSLIIARMRVRLNTQLRTYGCTAQFWWRIVLGRFAHITQTCKGLFSFKRTLFCWGPSGRSPKVRKNASKVRKYPSSLDLSKPKGLKKKTHLFSRPSVHPSKLLQQLAPQDQGEWMCSNPVYIPHKFHNVQMSAPPDHSKKQAKILHVDTNCGSKVVQPRSFSYAPGSEWCVRVPDPTSDRTSTKRSHDLA